MSTAGDGEFLAGEGTSSSGRAGRAELNVPQSTSVVLDGDVTFYHAAPNTVWRRQERLFLAT